MRNDRYYSSSTHAIASSKSDRKEIVSLTRVFPKQFLFDVSLSTTRQLTVLYATHSQAASEGLLFDTFTAIARLEVMVKCSHRIDFKSALKKQK